MKRAPLRSAPSAADAAIIIAEHGRRIDFELCFFVLGGDNFVRLRGGRHRIVEMRQLTFRCGACGQPVAEKDLNQHYYEHRSQVGVIAGVIGGVV